MDEVIKHNSRLWERKNGPESTFLFWCQGCGRGHTYSVPRWTFNGDYDRPTFNPSLRVFVPAGENRPEQTVCHLFVRDGELRYCDDCPHSFNGQSVPMFEIPENYGF